MKTSKQCRTCKQEKSIKCFYLTTVNGGRYARQSCIPCTVNLSKEQYEAMKSKPRYCKYCDTTKTYADFPQKDSRCKKCKYKRDRARLLERLANEENYMEYDKEDIADEFMSKHLKLPIVPLLRTYGGVSCRYVITN